MPLNLRFFLWLVSTVIIASQAPLHIGSATPAQTVPNGPTGSSLRYSARVENRRFGRIEMRASEDSAWVLVGRVMRPATATASSRAASRTGLVNLANSRQIEFSVGQGKTLTLAALRRSGVPSHRAGIGATAADTGSGAAAGTVATNLPAGAGLFGSLLPAKGSEAQLVMGDGAPTPFPDGYSPSGDDVFQFTVTCPAATRMASARPVGSQSLSAQIEQLGRRYSETAVVRGKRSGLRIVSGMLTLVAKLPSGEPDPIQAVTFAVDDDLVEVRNVAPFQYKWDSTRVDNGEHVVEIRAISARNAVITQARALIVVRNTPARPNGAVVQ